MTDKPTPLSGFPELLPEHRAAERSVIGAQIGSANQIEAVRAGFENRSPVFADLD